LPSVEPRPSPASLHSLSKWIPHTVNLPYDTGSERSPRENTSSKPSQLIHDKQTQGFRERQSEISPQKILQHLDNHLPHPPETQPPPFLLLTEDCSLFSSPGSLVSQSVSDKKSSHLLPEGRETNIVE
jgi:hypothetical protein